MGVIRRYLPGALVATGALISPLAGTGCAEVSSDTHEPGMVRQAKCISCHEAERKSAVSPPHESLPTTCQDCHTEEHWVPAELSFGHPWALEGAHARSLCASCHVGDPPVYEGTPTLCVGCHQDDYDNSPYLGHSDFPTTCMDCHTTDAWTPATGGNHPENAFPIESGAHSKYRDDCASCHDSALGSSIGGENADCVGCHDGEHTRAEMDAKHREVTNYPNGAAPPNFCLDCHSDGRN